MYKVLIWKEYREIRLSLAVITLSCSILALAVIILSNILDSYYVSNLRYAMPNGFDVLIPLTYIFIVSLMVLYTIIVGAEAFASEYQSKTFDFLISRAVSRNVLWYCKLSLRISTLLLPIIYFYLINQFLLMPEQASFQYQCIFAASILFLFSASFFLSSIFNRPVKAGATGVIVYLGYALIFFHFIDNYFVFAITCTIFAILILITSFIVFTKGKFSCAA